MTEAQKQGILRYRISPIVMNLFTYPVILLAYAFATFTFGYQRVSSGLTLVLVPAAAIVILHLYTLFILDDMLYIFTRYAKYAAFVRKAKKVFIVVILLYLNASIALIINGLNYYEHQRHFKARIEGISHVRAGAYSYYVLKLDSWHGKADPKRIILNFWDNPQRYYVGQSLDITVMSGRLKMEQVVKVGPDMEEYYKKVLSADPDSNFALRSLVDYYASVGRHDEALEMYRLYMMDKKEDKDGLGLRLAAGLINSNRFKTAARVLESNLEKSRDYETVNLLGHALSYSRDYPSAEKYLKEAIAMNPRDYRAYYTLGFVYEGSGRKQQALEAWSAVLKIMPRYPEVQEKVDNLKSELNKT